MDRPRFEYRTLECPFRELESALVELGSTGWHVHHVEKRTPTLSESAPRYEALYEVLLVRQTHADTLERAVLALAERIEALENKQALHKTEHARAAVEEMGRRLRDGQTVIGPTSRGY